MKLIKLEILTDKGREAYDKINNLNLNWTERNVEKIICKRKIVSTIPLKINFIIKMPKLAEALELDEKIISTMTLKGCERDLDYILEVE